MILSKKQISHSTVLLTIILLVSSLGQVCSDLYLPSLPYIAKSLHVNNNWAQFTVAIYMAGFSLSQLIYGPMSDAVGRRPPLLFGLTINFIGSFICWMSPNIYLLFLGRFLQGLGVGAGTSLARPMLRDLFEKETLALYNSYLAISTVVILSAAPILGGYIQYYAGWRFNFLFLTIYGLLILSACQFRASETNQHFNKDNYKLKIIFQNALTIIKSNTFRRFSLCPFFTYAGIVAWLTATPIVLQEKVGLNSVQLGWLYICSGIGFALGAFLNTKFIKRFGINFMMQFGFMVQLSAGIFMLFFYLFGYINTYVIIVPILVFMMGSSLIFPNSSAGALSPFPKIAGMAGAIFGFMQILGGALSSSTIALAHDENQSPIAISFIITSILSILAFRIFKKEKDES